MKNKVLVLLLVLFVVALGAYRVSAKGSEGDGVQAQVGNSGGEVQVQVQSQDQIRSESNYGDSNATGSQMQVRQENQVQSTNEIKAKNESDSSSPESSNGTSSDRGGKEIGQVEPVKMAEQVRSEVANVVQALLQIADRNGGIGSEIKIVAQAQNDNQVKIEDSIKKIESRSGLAKFFIGPDYGEINNAQKVLEQNKLQVTQLNQIKSQISNQADQQKLTEQISALEQANADIEASLNQTGGGFSLFGWLFRTFSK